MFLWHTVLISFGDDVSEESRKKIYNLYQTLDRACGGKRAGILFWKVSRNLDQRKNVHLVEIAAFRDDAALQVFRAHPKHKEVTDLLSASPNTKWWVGDIQSQDPFP